MGTYTSGTSATTYQPFISSSGALTTNFNPSSFTGSATSPNGNVYYYLDGISGKAKGYSTTASVTMGVGTTTTTRANGSGATSCATGSYTSTFSYLDYVVRTGVTYYAGYYANAGIYSTRSTGDTGFSVYANGTASFTSSQVFYQITYQPTPNTTGSLSFSNVTQTSIDITFPAYPTYADNFWLQWSTDSSFASVTGSYAYGSAGIPTTASGLTAGTTYYFRFSANYLNAVNANSSATGPWSGVVSQSTQAAVQAPSFNTNALPSGRVDQGYYVDVYPNGGGTADSVSASNLPPGITATNQGSYVQLYGTPTASGSYNVNLSASNAGGSSGTVTKNLTISAPYAPTASSTNFTQGTQGSAYPGSTITFSNTKSVSGAPSTLAGLTVSVDANGITLSGTPTVPLTSSTTFTLVGATDNGSPTNTSVTLSIYVVPNNATWPTYTFPDGKVNANYSSTITATNAQSVSGGITPSNGGLSISASGTSSLVVSGIPTISGTYTVTGTANGAAGTTPDTFTKTFTVAPLVPPVWVDTSLSTSMTVGQSYATTSGGNNSVSATGATSFTIQSGSLPAGLSGAVSNGVWTLSGTPTTRGSYAFVLRATNADGNASPDQTFSGTVVHPPTWNDQTLGDISQGRAYSDSVSVVTSTAITWTISGLPAGLTGAASGTNSSTYTISGTATGSGAYSIVLRATNGDGFIEKTFTGTIKLPPNWTDNQLGSVVQGVEYFDSVIATNSPTYEIVAGGTLPTGISLNTSTGAFTGTATVLNEAYSFTVRAYNAEGEVSQAFSGTVQPDLGGGIKVYNGTDWTTAGNQPVYVYDGTTWVEGKVYTYNGNIWVKSLF